LPNVKQPGTRWGKKKSHYKPEYADQVYEHMAAGGTLAQFCAKIGICVAQFDIWLELHSDLVEAHAAGVTACSAYWEDFALQHIDNPNLNTTAFKIVLMNRANLSERRKFRFTKVLEADTAENQRRELSKLVQGGVTAGDLKEITSAVRDLSELTNIEKMERDLAEIKQARVAERDTGA